MDIVARSDEICSKVQGMEEREGPALCAFCFPDFSLPCPLYFRLHFTRLRLNFSPQQNK